jgi:hypothetical protein
VSHPVHLDLVAVERANDHARFRKDPPEQSEGRFSIDRRHIGDDEIGFARGLRGERCPCPRDDVIPVTEYCVRGETYDGEV